MNQGLFPGLVLLAYIPLVWYFLSAHSPAKGTTMAVVGATLFLPVGAAFDLPVLPPLDKHTLPAMVVAAILWTRLPRASLMAPMRFLGWLFALDCVGALGTVLTNRQTFYYGRVNPVVLPSLSATDFPGLVLEDVFYDFLPFYLGAIAITTPAALTSMIRIVVKGGLLLTPFALFEVRMSPNLHLWTYGYAAHMGFEQTKRWGGYRPQIYFYHGLVAAFFLMMTTLASAIATRTRIGLGALYGRWVLPYLTVVLVLCKSTGALLYAVAGIPILLLSKAKTQLRISVIIGLIVLSYPYTRTTGLFPTDALIEWAQNLGERRAGSLAFRFEHEEAVLEKAIESGRTWFGWGGYGRSWLYDEWSGRALTVIDGRWIIEFGKRGVVGLVVSLMPLLWPVWLIFRRRERFRDPRLLLMVSGVSLIVMFAAAETLPNDPQITLHPFLAGALYGMARATERARPGPVRPGD